MSNLNLSKTSKAWPWIKAIARHATIPGTKIGMEAIFELQDDLADEQFQDQVKAMLEVIYLRTAEITDRLQREENLVVKDEGLRLVSQQLAEAFYLKQTADKHFYADFKGIAQENKFVSLPLDEVFVDLNAAPENRDTRRQRDERELRARLEATHKEVERVELLTALEQLDVEKREDQKGDGGLSIGELLKARGATVLLGGPGSGKTTLVKRLARTCALGVETLKDRYPGMPWGFPVVIPATQLATERGSQSLLDYAEEVIRKRGGEALLACYRDHFTNQKVIFLVDGLDEVADAVQRVASARAVDEAVGSLGNNRLLVTSRQVGYAICRLSAPAAHFLLLPFTPRDVSTFVIQWHLAYERANKEDKADLASARKDGQSLNEEIERNSSVASLATNPLMLTIIALIKHQNVVLPERRVELYEVALKTLIHSWNLARSLAQVQSNRPLGESQPRVEQTRLIWSAVAYWMHETANREVNRTLLHNKIVEVLTSEFDKDQFEAEEIAESYLNVAAETCGLLEPRGPNTFAFVHQSFQEYLAALHIARPPSKAIGKLREHCHDPRWHEIIRLATGHLGITLGEREVLAEIVDELLNNSDPLEPLLCTSLLLALGCLADQVGIRQQQTDTILSATIKRYASAKYSRTRTALAKALGLIEVTPGEAVQSELLELAKEPGWLIRMEAIRLVGSSKRLGISAKQELQRVSNNDAQDSDVRAHAAWGLWKHGERNHKLAVAIAAGLTSDFAHMRHLPVHPLLEALLKLLEDPEAKVRYQAASVLGQWGPQETALPALLKLLEDPEAGLRSRAARVLGQWGPQELNVVKALLKEVAADAKLFPTLFVRPGGDRTYRIEDEDLRTELVTLFTPSGGEGSQRSFAIREILFDLFWRSCATAA